MRFERVVVTGGSGRLGRFVVDELRDHCAVSVLDIAAPRQDVPYFETDILDPEGLRAALAGQEAAVVIVPSSDGGTALLMRRPPQRIAACFGPESARRHDEAARQQGEIPVQLTRLGQDAALDLDTPEDAQRVLASGRTCRTRALLERLDS